mgnify:CR=1 FL=1
MEGNEQRGGIDPHHPAPHITSEQYRARARECEAQARESFERCDTDGFRSQHALGLGARLNDLKADLTDAGCMCRWSGLYDGDRRLRAKVITTRFGTAWLLDECEAEKYGRKFVPDGPRSTVQKKLGLSERGELAPTWATTNETSACCFRSGCEWGTDAELIEGGAL